MPGQMQCLSWPIPDKLRCSMTWTFAFRSLSKTLLAISQNGPVQKHQKLHESLDDSNGFFTKGSWFCRGSCWFGENNTPRKSVKTVAAETQGKNFHQLSQSFKDFLHISYLSGNLSGNDSESWDALSSERICFNQLGGLVDHWVATGPEEPVPLTPLRMGNWVESQWSKHRSPSNSTAGAGKSHGLFGDSPSPTWKVTMGWWDAMGWCTIKSQSNSRPPNWNANNANSDCAVNGLPRDISQRHEHYESRGASKIGCSQLLSTNLKSFWVTCPVKHLPWKKTWASTNPMCSKRGDFETGGLEGKQGKSWPRKPLNHGNFSAQARRSLLDRFLTLQKRHLYQIMASKRFWKLGALEKTQPKLYQQFFLLTPWFVHFSLWSWLRQYSGTNSLWTTSIFVELFSGLFFVAMFWYLSSLEILVRSVP